MVFCCPGFQGDFDPLRIFQRILVPVDFGPESRRAIVTACVLRQQFGSEIHVFHLRAFGINDEYIRGLGAPWSESDIDRESKNQLRMFGENICKGMPCVYHEAIVGEDVVQGITEAAEKCNATLVILPVVHPGTRGGYSRALHQGGAGADRGGAGSSRARALIPVTWLERGGVSS
jgi:hypothetical protein